MPKKRSRWGSLLQLQPIVNVQFLLANWFLLFLQSLADELDCCGRALSDMDAAVQEFARRNPLLAKQLSDAISKLSEMHHQTTRVADCRNNWLKKVCIHRSLVQKFLCFNIQKRCPRYTGAHSLCCAWLVSLASVAQAVCYLDEYDEMLDFIVRWSEKAKSLVRANIIWNSSVHLQEQIRMYLVSWGFFLLWYTATAFCVIRLHYLEM